MQKTLKRFGLVLLLALFASPVVLVGGCEGKVDGDGVDLEVG